MAKKLAVIGLILVLLVLVVPLGIGMAMAPCQDCPVPLASGMATCLGLLIAIALVFPSFAAAVSSIVRPPRRLMLTASLERPPRPL